MMLAETNGKVRQEMLRLAPGVLDDGGDASWCMAGPAHHIRHLRGPPTPGRRGKGLKSGGRKLSVMCSDVMNRTPRSRNSSSRIASPTSSFWHPRYSDAASVESK
jgi:hypothetical protein